MGRRNIRKQIIKERIHEVRNLEKEYNEICIAQRNLGHIKLEKPIRNGWCRTFKLRSDIAKHKEVDAYQEAMESITYEIWGAEKKYADKNWANYFKRTCLHYQRPGIKFLDEKEYLKLSSSARKYFLSLQLKMWYRYEKIYYCTLPRYYFVKAYRRAYITHRKIISADLERRGQEILEILCRAEYCKYSKYVYHNYTYYASPKRSLRRKTNMALSRFDTETLEELNLRTTKGDGY